MSVKASFPTLRVGKEAFTDIATGVPNPGGPLRRHEARP